MSLPEKQKQADYWESVKKEILANAHKQIESAYPDGRMPDFIARQISEYWQSLHKLTQGGK